MPNLPLTKLQVERLILHEKSSVVAQPGFIVVNRHSFNVGRTGRVATGFRQAVQSSARERFSKIVLASPCEFPYSTSSHGGVAQLGERLTGSQEVRGSIPLVSTTVNAKSPGNWRLFSYEATAQTKVTPHQQPHPKKLRNLFPTSVHSLLTQHNSILHFTPSALQLGRCVPTAAPA